MTNKSMIRADKNTKKAGAGEGDENLSRKKSSDPLADENHPHSPQLKPVIDEKRSRLQKRDEK